MGLDQVAARALQRNQDTRPVSGRQELLENIVNQEIWAADRAGSADPTQR